MQGYLTYINSLDRHIEFTLEMELADGKLPFLDCLVHRKADGSIKTTVYKKPSDAERLLPYQSEHPK